MSSNDLRALEVNAAQLAIILGVSQTKVVDLEDKGVFRADPATDKYIVAVCVPKWGRHLKNLTKKAKGEDTGYEGARAKKMRAAAELEEISLAEKKGELVSIDEITDIVKTEYEIVRQRLFGIPTKVALDVFSCQNADEVHEVLLRALNEALDELKYDVEATAHGSKTKDSKAEPEADPSRVGGHPQVFI